MKRVTLILLSLALVCIGATSALAEVTVSGDAYVTLNSKYVWRGFDLSPDANFVLQPGVDISAKGFTVSYWSNWDEDSADMNETDLTLDYSFDASDLVSLSVGNIFYALDGLDDTNELYASVTFNTLLSPSVTAYYDWDEADETGLFFTAAIGHTFEFSDTLALNLGALVSYNLESDYAVGDYSAFHNAELSASLDWSCPNTGFVVSPAVLFSTPLSDDAEDIAGLDDEVVVGVNLAYNF